MAERTRDSIQESKQRESKVNKELLWPILVGRSRVSSHIGGPRAKLGGSRGLALPALIHTSDTPLSRLVTLISLLCGSVVNCEVLN